MKNIAQEWLIKKNGDCIKLSNRTKVPVKVSCKNTCVSKNKTWEREKGSTWVNKTAESVISSELQTRIETAIKGKCNSCSRAYNNTCLSVMSKKCQEEKQQEIEKILKENNISGSNIFFATFLNKNIKMIAPSDNINLSEEDTGNILYECFELFKKIADICHIELEYDADNIDFDATASIGEHVLKMLETSEFTIRKD